MEHLSSFIENTFKGHRWDLLDFSDGQLHTEDGCSFPIHRFVLADKSQYFFALFRGIEKDKKEALIPGITGDVLSSILTYIYTGEIHTTTENICDLIIAADYILLDDLLSQMKTSLAQNLSVANSLAIFSAAWKINSGDIFKQSLRFVEIHFEDIMRCKSKEFYELSLEALKQLLSDRNLRVRSEDVIWDAIVAWVSAYLPNRLPCVPDLLLCLRVADVYESLAEQILQHDLVAKNTSCQGICAIKSTNPEFNSIRILQHFIQNNPSPNLSFYAHRSPSHLQFVAHYLENNVTKIYVTYDEKLDLWRKILEVDSDADHFLAINDCIYMFGNEDPVLRFSIIEKQWLQFGDFRNPRYAYTPVKLNGFIYILGGFSSEGDDDEFDVEIYDPDDDTWYDTTPMPPVFHFGAVTLNESIYVVGHAARLTDEVIAEVYNSVTESWNALPRPAVNRSSFAMAAYHEKLYVIGGSNPHWHDSPRIWKEVEVFDPANNIWSRAADLPYDFYYPKAVVINDQMIVYETDINPTTRRLSPSVVWKVKDEWWERIEGSFSNTTWHTYDFFSLENVEYVNVIAKENKDPETVFEKSPFS